MVKARKGVIQENKVSTVIHYGEHVYRLAKLAAGCDPCRDRFSGVQFETSSEKNLHCISSAAKLFALIFT